MESKCSKYFKASISHRAWRLALFNWEPGRDLFQLRLRERSDLGRAARLSPKSINFRSSTCFVFILCVKVINKYVRLHWGHLFQPKWPWCAVHPTLLQAEAINGASPNKNGLSENRPRPIWIWDHENHDLEGTAHFLLWSMLRTDPCRGFNTPYKLPRCSRARLDRPAEAPVSRSCQNSWAPLAPCRGSHSGDDKFWQNTLW